jgi:hypothetical protein
MSSLPIEEHYVRFEVFTAVTMNNGVFWNVMPCGSFMKATRIGELGTTLSVTSNRRTLRRILH